MNNNIISSSNKTIESVGDMGEEESGWTDYLEDFSSSHDGSNPSLVSDAAWYGSDSINHFKTLKFNTLRRSNISDNLHKKYDDLEDTATSPANSPKVSTLKKMEMINHQRVDIFVSASNFPEKQAGGSTIDFPELSEKNVKNIVDGRRGNTSDRGYTQENVKIVDDIRGNISGCGYIQGSSSFNR